MKDLKVNSVVHVTKVTAVVAWATEDRKTVPMSLRVRLHYVTTYNIYIYIYIG